MSTRNETGERLLRSIRRIIRCVAEQSRRMHADVGLTVPQLLSLRAIEELEREGGDITVAKVAARIQLTAPTVSRVVDRLVKAGLVTRERDGGDRRKVVLHLTAAGAERYSTAPAPLQEELIAKLLVLPAADRNRLLDAMDEVADLMGAGDMDAAPMLVSGAMEPPVNE